MKSLTNVKSRIDKFTFLGQSLKLFLVSSKCHKNTLDKCEIGNTNRWLPFRMKPGDILVWSIPSLSVLWHTDLIFRINPLLASLPWTIMGHPTSHFLCFLIVLSFYLHLKKIPICCWVTIRLEVGLKIQHWFKFKLLSLSLWQWQWVNLHIVLHICNIHSIVVCLLTCYMCRAVTQSDI